VLLQVGDVPEPPGLETVRRAEGVQMVAPRDARFEPASEAVRLGEADAADMLALATLTEPGPFLSRTHALGRFWGVRIDGRLAAMAGERLRQEGYVEVSGVCTHPDFRGLGLAGALSAHVAAAIRADGATPYLHAYATNTVAIQLYERLGFRLRTTVNVAMFRA
jgi:predicted GNAT family acetyltransferase